MVARCAFVSFRLGLTDGVSIVAETWRRAFEDLGWDTVTVAGDGPVDRAVAGLEIDATGPPDPAELAKALADADLTVVENLLSIPLNLPASRAVAAELRGRPALLHHHDPPWQRARFADVTELPPDDPAWVHVTINRFTEDEFAERGLRATTIYNGFDTSVESGDRLATRAALGVDVDTLLVLHPVRAIARKNIPGALALTEALGGTYWMPGPAEEGYAPELQRLIQSANAPILRTPLPAVGPDVTIADAYAACDLVVFPSLWEGFGNPPVEAAIHGRPVAVGSYRVADELRGLGFDWLDAADHQAVAAALATADQGVLARNRAVAKANLSLEIMRTRVAELLELAGWRP